jgi:elongation factor 1-beta
MQALEVSVRSIKKDGLVWGASKLLPVGYGVNKLQISLVVEDEKVSLQDLEEEIADFEDYVQSTDLVSNQPRTMWMKLMLTVPIPGCYAKAINGLHI